MTTITKWSDVAIAVQSALAAADTISAITKANPGVASSTAHGMLDGAYAKLTISGMHQLDGRVVRVAGVAWMACALVAAMQAATSIMRAQQIVLARVDRALEPWSLTFARYEVLVLLHFSKAGALPLGKMGDRLMLHQASVTNLVDRLEAQGYLRRVPHPTDRRTTLAELTADGRAIIEEATAAVVAASVGVADLTERDQRDLHRILAKLRLGAGDFDPATS